MQASATAGLGAPFVAAAAPKTAEPGEGRLALVLPVTVCTGPSWAQTRRIIEQNFSLDYGHHVSRPSAMELLGQRRPFRSSCSIATRRASDSHALAQDRGEPHSSICGGNPQASWTRTAWRSAVASTSPATPIEGTGTALLEIDGLHVGEALSVPESMLRGGKWIGMQFARADLTRSAVRLLRGQRSMDSGGAGDGGHSSLQARRAWPNWARPTQDVVGRFRARTHIRHGVSDGRPGTPPRRCASQCASG